MPPPSVLAPAVWPTAKVAHLGATAATVALAGLPAVATVARGGTNLGSGVVLLILGAGASLAWAIDDESDESLLAMPVSAPVRTTLRALATAMVAALVTAAALGVVAVGPGLPPDLADRIPEGVAAAAVALAIASVASRRGERTAGATGAIAGLLLPAVVAGLALRWPTWFPTFGPGAVHTRWWLVTVACAIVTARSGRDPGRR